MSNPTDKKQLFKMLLIELNAIISGDANTDEKFLSICKLLNSNVEYYDWVGFYFVNPNVKGELFLGPYDGDSTDHVRIEFGHGICGQAAERKETFVVQDVSKETDYLSCSPQVKSEIVVPILKDGEVVGELDIDSHTISPFTEEDQEFLETVSVIIADLF
ncbi:MAG: GAF domain-containing protein [Thermoplasmata archaeon]|nr:GAF domain-containing protein [Thermoplasmata archaeon]